MASTEPKMRSITGRVTSNKLTEREDDFTFLLTVGDDDRPVIE